MIDVNAATRHATRATARNGFERDLPDSFEAAQPSRPRPFDVLDLLKGETVVKTKTNDGTPAVIRIPHSILAILVTIALAAVAGGFWLVSSITEMRTNLAYIQQGQRDIKATQSSNLKLMTAYATNETNRVNFMTALLTKEQQQQVFGWDRANPRPQLPDTNDSPEDERQKN